MVKRLLYERKYPFITSLVAVEDWHPASFDGPNSLKRRSVRFAVPLSGSWVRRITGTSLLHLVDEHTAQLGADGTLHFRSAPRVLVPGGRQLPLYVQMTLTMVVDVSAWVWGARGTAERVLLRDATKACEAWCAWCGRRLAAALREGRARPLKPCRWVKARFWCAARTKACEAWCAWCGRRLAAALREGRARPRRPCKVPSMQQEAPLLRRLGSAVSCGTLYSDAASLSDGDSSDASSARTRSPSPPRVRKALSEYSAGDVAQGTHSTPFAGVAPKAAPGHEAGSPHKEPTGNPFARSTPPAAGGARSPHRGPSPARNSARAPVPRLPLPLPLPLPKVGMAPASGSPVSTPGAPRALAAAPEAAAQGRGAQANGGAAGGSRRGWHEKLCLLGVFCMGHGCSARAEG